VFTPWFKGGVKHAVRCKLLVIKQLVVRVCEVVRISTSIAMLLG